MGQKVNPHGIRVGVIKDWDSRWFASKKDFSDNLVASQLAAFFRVRSVCASVRFAACSGVSGLYFMVSMSFWNGA